MGPMGKDRQRPPQMLQLPTPTPALIAKAWPLLTLAAQHGPPQGKCPGHGPWNWHSAVQNMYCCVLGLRLNHTPFSLSLNFLICIMEVWLLGRGWSLQHLHRVSGPHRALEARTKSADPEACLPALSPKALGSSSTPLCLKTWASPPHTQQSPGVSIKPGTVKY